MPHIYVIHIWMIISRECLLSDPFSNFESVYNDLVYLYPDHFRTFSVRFLVLFLCNNNSSPFPIWALDWSFVCFSMHSIPFNPISVGFAIVQLLNIFLIIIGCLRELMNSHSFYCFLFFSFWIDLFYLLLPKRFFVSVNSINQSFKLVITLSSLSIYYQTFIALYNCICQWSYHHCVHQINQWFVSVYSPLLSIICQCHDLLSVLSLALMSYHSHCWNIHINNGRFIRTRIPFLMDESSLFLSIFFFLYYFTSLFLFCIMLVLLIKRKMSSLVIVCNISIRCFEDVERAFVFVHHHYQLYNCLVNWLQLKLHLSLVNFIFKIWVDSHPFHL